MKLYCGIDLHSNNSYVVLLDESDKIVYKKRLANDIEYYENYPLIGNKFLELL